MVVVFLPLLLQVEIPNVDDHISKLEHMGKETVKKLADIRGSAAQVGLDIAVPDNTINKGVWSEECTSREGRVVRRQGWWVVRRQGWWVVEASWFPPTLSTRVGEFVVS